MLVSRPDSKLPTTERRESDDKPERVSQAYINGFSRERRAWPIPDREKGALKRAKAILSARNARAYVDGICTNPATFYHQGDPRGCALYVMTAEWMGDRFAAWKAENSGANPFHYDFAQLDQLYTRGLAVCY